MFLSRKYFPLSSVNERSDIVHHPSPRDINLHANWFVPSIFTSPESMYSFLPPFVLHLVSSFPMPLRPVSVTFSFVRGVLSTTRNVCSSVHEIVKVVVNRSTMPHTNAGAPKPDNNGHSESVVFSSSSETVVEDGTRDTCVHVPAMDWSHFFPYNICANFAMMKELCSEVFSVNFSTKSDAVGIFPFPSLLADICSLISFACAFLRACTFRT